MNFEAVKGFIRHALTFGGGFLVSANFLDASQVDTAAAAIVTLIGIVWSVLDKKKRENV